MKRIFFILLVAGSILIPSFSFAADNSNLGAKLPLGSLAPKYQYHVVYLYHGEECPHCQAERKFLDDLKKELPGLEVKEFEVWHNSKNAQLMQEAADKLGVKVQGVPFTVVGDNYVVGFDDAEGIGQQIREFILNASSTVEQKEGDVRVPVLGKINLKEESLPILTALIGVLDGFNPCSMWALLTMITIIMSTGDRKKLWIVGWTFIIVSGFSYFIFMSAWLNALVFLSFLPVIRIAVGLLGIGSGSMSLYEFFTKKPEVCEVSSPEKQVNIVERFRKVVSSPTMVGLIVGVAGVAFSVNLVELMCSLGFPVVYTQALALHNVTIWQKYLYIAAYVFFYMLLNIIVLLAAGFSSKYVIGNSKFTRWSRLVAGLAMVLLGLIFIFKPELLSF